MTRVILTNKQTGQELPEAEMETVGRTSIDVRFDGTSRTNVFGCDDWDYREVRTFRNGDVLRRKDRDDIYVQYIYVVEVDGTGGQWLEINSDGSTHVHANPSALNGPDWELV